MSIFFERKSQSANTDLIKLATWNVAAINNNPFEYWVTYPGEEYNHFMVDVERFMSNIENDVPVKTVFTDEMYLQLVAEMKSQHMETDKLSIFWAQDYSQRLAINEFLKDKAIGEKRLTSMPDRITNTINLWSGEKLKRPSVINSYDACDLTSTRIWWREWRKFMFCTKIQISAGGEGVPKPQFVCNLIRPICRTKYPAVSLEEQAISVQLQLLCLAILDATFIFIVNQVAPTTWQVIRRTLSLTLVHGKEDRLCQILADSYGNCHAIFLQEASAALVRKARAHPALSRWHDVLLPDALDARRDQNSVILVDRRRFNTRGAVDAPQRVLDHVEGGLLEPGDLFAADVADVAGRRFLLVSFHGDSAGLSAAPAVHALHRACRGEALRGHTLVAGLDANTRTWQGVAAFGRLLADQGMASVWDGGRDPFAKTTCGARTSLQPQLHKAVPYARRFSAATVSLKVRFRFRRHACLSMYTSTPRHATPPHKQTLGSGRTGSCATRRTCNPSRRRSATTRARAASTRGSRCPPPPSPPTTPSSRPPSASAPCRTLRPSMTRKAVARRTSSVGGLRRRRRWRRRSGRWLTAPTQGHLRRRRSPCPQLLRRAGAGAGGGGVNQALRCGGGWSLTLGGLVGAGMSPGVHCAAPCR